MSWDHSRSAEFASAILLDTQGRLLFQRRDSIPGILYPGMVALFGGKREANETFLECVCREVHEEVSYFLPHERFERMGSYSDPDNGTKIGEFFIARDVPVEALRITEGTLLVVEPSELDELLPKLIPSTYEAVRMFAARQRA
jgi:8-oxo-dGTP diphosphatase